MVEALESILSEVSPLLDDAPSWISMAAALASAAIAWMVYRDQSSPDVVAYISQVSEGSATVALYIENIGAAPAYDVSVEAAGELPVTDGMRDGVETFLGHGISLLMPGARRGTYLGVSHELMSGCRGGGASVTVRFARRRGGRRVAAEFPMDMLSFEFALLDKPFALQKVEEIARQSKRAADELKGARAALQGIDRKLTARDVEEME